MMGMDMMRAASASRGQKEVGVVSVQCPPITILGDAYRAARFMCLRDFKVSPELYVNGVPYDEYVLRAESLADQRFPYVHTHLFYIFLELLKNAARASVERACLESGDPSLAPLLDL